MAMSYELQDQFRSLSQPKNAKEKILMTTYLYLLPIMSNFMWFMLRNHFTEGWSVTDFALAPTKKIPSTSANLLPTNLVQPEDRIKSIKRRMTNPIGIDASNYDPTVLKKPRYEHSRIIKKNQVTSSIKNIQSSTDMPQVDTSSKLGTNPSTSEHVEKSSYDNNDLASIPDSASNTSSDPT